MKKLLLLFCLFASPVFANSNIDSSESLRPVRRVVCVARSGFWGVFGQTYRGYGNNRWQASRRALRQCHRFSYQPSNCRIAYCSQGGGGWWDNNDDDDDDDDDFAGPENRNN